jgi:type IV pilus assembly protein PilQ
MIQTKQATTSIDLRPGRANFAIAKLNNGSLLDLELAALESEGRGKVISSPKLLTADRQAAYIESGAEIPYQEKTKRGDTSITFKKAVLSLKVTPEVVAEDTVNLLLQLNQDKVSQLTVNGVPVIDTRKIQTQVLVRNGETVVLGGIYEWSKSNNIIGIPVLGKIPLLGLLFRKQETKMERKELLMFVTPRIVEQT